MNDLLKEDVSSVDVLKGKTLVMVLGPRDSAKSTFATCMLEPDSLSNDDDDNLITSASFEFNGRRMFEMNDVNKEGTTVPGYYPIEDNDEVYLVDCPGFDSSFMSTELVNFNKLKLIMNAASKILVCVVIKEDILQSDRGSGYLKFMTSLARFIPENSIDDSDDNPKSKVNILPFITAMNTSKTLKKIEKLLCDTPAEFLDKKMEAFYAEDLSEYSEILDQFSDEQYPKKYEITQVKALM